MQYRREIDGLRAVAIVPVVLFHAGFQAFSGGFAGVDVFFVISGYLITSLIAIERREASFSIVSFYERRARRILPPLFAMTIACLPFSWFLMTPSALKRFGEGLIAVCLFVSNFLFFFQTGYFAPSELENPLLHTWTLAVEEQYYLLFPLLLAVIWPLGRRLVITSVMAVLLASFAFAHLGGSFSSQFPFIDSDWQLIASDFGFYLTPARAWELMVGSLFALFLPGGAFARRPIVSDAASALGLSLILCAVFAFDDANTPFPSVYTLVPTIGTLLVIAFAVPGTAIGALLSARPVVGVGLISYSIYLWHQPLFAFARLYFSDPPLWAFGALSLASAGLGYLSWQYIEKPFRDRTQFSRKQIFIFAILTTIGIIGAGLALVISDGGVSRFPAKDRYLISVDPKGEGWYVNEKFNSLDKPFSKAGNRPRVLIVGDSFAQDLVNMLNESGTLTGYDVSTHYVPRECAMVWPERDTPFCRKVSPFRSETKARLQEANIVIVTNSWSVAAAQGLRAYLSRLGLSDRQKLIVVGSKFLGPIHPIAYIKLSPSARLALRNYEPPLPANAVLQRNFGPAFFDLMGALCGPQRLCPVFAPNGKLISFYGSHLTQDGAKFMGKRIARRILE